MSGSPGSRLTDHSLKPPHFQVSADSFSNESSDILAARTADRAIYIGIVESRPILKPHDSADSRIRSLNPRGAVIPGADLAVNDPRIIRRFPGDSARKRLRSGCTSRRSDGYLCHSVFHRAAFHVPDHSTDCSGSFHIAFYLTIKNLGILRISCQNSHLTHSFDRLSWFQRQISDLRPIQRTKESNIRRTASCKPEI